MRTALLLLLLLITPAWSEEINPPDWSEFCPPEHCNAQVVDEPGFSNGKHFAAHMLTLGFSAPFSYHARKKQSKAVMNNYWVNRRQQFNNEVELCKRSSGDKTLCYLQVRQMETQKNADLQAHEDSKALRRTVNSTKYIRR